ncbi:hypothetical protein Holit_02952 [Hollandina sp. SP2]
MLSETMMKSETRDAQVKEVHSGQAVYHVNRDSTALDAREKRKTGGKQEQKRCGRPKKGEIRPAKAESIIAKQDHERVEEALKNIDRAAVRKTVTGLLSFGPITNCILM